MSTILKALRRLEQEKTPAHRPLREQVTGPAGEDREEAAAARRWPILLAGIGAGVVAGVAVLVLVLSRGGDSPPLPPATEEPAPAALPAAAPSAAASDNVEVIDRGDPAPRVMAPEPVEAAVAATAGEPAPGSVRPFQHALRRARATPQAPAPAPVIAEPPLRAPVPPPQPVVEAPMPQAAMSPVPAAAPAVPAAARPEPIRAASRPPPPPDRFPALRVERTTWHPLAERRVAVVDVPGEGARELREGDPVAGATVSLIEPSGVVFRYEGRDVRRKVGAGS